MKKNILVIMRSAPYGSSSAKDAIDFILTASAYDQDINVLFTNDGVFQLLSEQKTKDPKVKRIASLISAFEMYDIENVFCEINSLRERDISEHQLLDCAKIIDHNKVTSLLNNADTVLNF